VTSAIELLINAGKLDANRALELDRYMTDHGRTILQALIEHAGVDRGDVLWAFAAESGFESIPDLAAVRADPNALIKLSKGKAEEWGVIPMSYEGSTLIVAAPMSVAQNPQINENLHLALDGAPYRWVVSTKAHVKAKILSEYRNEEEIASLSETVRGGGTQATEAAERTVSLILEQAVKDGASDIHLDPSERDVFVRYRIDGVMIDRTPLAAGLREAVASVIKIRSNIDVADSRKPADGRLSENIAGRKIDMRVATLPTVWGEKVVMRILDNSTAVRPLTDFAFSEKNAARWRHGFDRPDGMVLVTGPTGSGKSTTLYATLNEISRPEVNIITVEDPVEYRIAHINQVQVNPKAGLTFASALRSILRSDPDVVLIGEIRDLETATIAIEAALTGHLVLTTLHTNSAPQTAVRLVEMGVEPFLAQRLIRRLCPACKVRYEPTRDELAAVGYSTSNPEPHFYRPEGCNKCAGVGYRGRLALHETMVRTPALENALANGANVQTITALAVEDGMIPLRQDGWEKVAQGVTTIPEVLRVVSGEGFTV